MTPNPKRWRHRLGELLRPLDIESGLLHCNHVLAACRSEESSPIASCINDELGQLCTPFLVQLAAREIIRHGLGPAERKMGIVEFNELIVLLWDMLIDDSLRHDVDGLHLNLAGFLLRYCGLQQRVVDVHLQNYGLTSALFTNSLSPSQDAPLDISSLMEECLGMSPEVFMRLGFIAGHFRSARYAGASIPGTVSTASLNQWSKELGADVVTHWPRFRELVTCSVAKFKQKCFVDSNTERDSGSHLYRLNPLWSFPLVETAADRFVSPDPEMVLIRTSLGMYYDALSLHGTRFTEPFGPRFSNAVGDLLRSACGNNQVWSEASVFDGARAKYSSKNVDHVILGEKAYVLIECKALRPSAGLLMRGEPRDTQAIVERVADAAHQINQHADAIQQGRWARHGLQAKCCVAIVVTYGRIPIVNGELFRDLVQRRNASKCQFLVPYLVLSLSELDSFLRLVENGNDPSDVVKRLCVQEHGVFPGSFQDVLASDAVSGRTRARGMAFLSTVSCGGKDG